MKWSADPLLDALGMKPQITVPARTVYPSGRYEYTADDEKKERQRQAKREQDMKRKAKNAC